MKYCLTLPSESSTKKNDRKKRNLFCPSNCILKTARKKAQFNVKRTNGNVHGRQHTFCHEQELPLLKRAQFTIAHLDQQLRHVCLDWQFFFVGRLVFVQPLSMIQSAGRNLLDPITLVGFLLQARAIVWPTAVIAPVTMLLWTCHLCPQNPVLAWAANPVGHQTRVVYVTCCKYGSTPQCLTQAHQFSQCISLVLVVASNCTAQKASSARRKSCA